MHLFFSEIGKMCDVGPQTIKKQSLGVMEIKEHIPNIALWSHNFWAKNALIFLPEIVKTCNFGPPSQKKMFGTPQKEILIK